MDKSLTSKNILWFFAHPPPISMCLVPEEVDSSQRYCRHKEYIMLTQIVVYRSTYCRYSTHATAKNAVTASSPLNIWGRWVGSERVQKDPFVTA